MTRRGPIAKGSGADDVRAEQILSRIALQDAIFNSAYFSSIATDERGVIQIFNVGAERMLGYPASEVINFTTPADLTDPQELVARASDLSSELGTTITPGFEALVFKASRGIEDIYDLTYVRKDGTRFPAVVSVTSLRDIQDQIIGYLLIGTDNTARKLIEANQAELDQRLRDQQFYTRSLIESNLDALMMTDPQGIISDVNQQMITLTGRTRDELIGAPSKNFFTNPALAEAAIKRVLAENRVSNYELTVRAENGEETDVSYNAATVYNRERKLQGVFAAARDITERKVLDRALQEKNIELEHASRMKSEFLANMSHELRTPLNAIIGFSEAMKDGLVGEMSPSQLEYMGDIFASGQHLLSLINDILDLSKVEAGMMSLELEPTDFRGLLAGSLTIVKEKAAVQRVKLELDADGDFPTPLLDVRKTKQIVYNLLANAVKFSASGELVKLSARLVGRSEVGTIPGGWPTYAFPLAQSAYDRFLEICVTDGGIGISEPDMTKLFQAFSQIDSSLSRNFEGTGLGLAMVRQLAELHGGTVAVASIEKKGARFVVWLPLRSASEPSAVGNTRAAVLTLAKPFAGSSALVVEDDDQSADLVRLLLEVEGFTVTTVKTGEQAMELAPNQIFDLITLDVQLPGMNGWEFLARIRERSDLAHVPVVIISGAGQADNNLALERGAASHLQKPISRLLLHDALENLGLQPDLDKVRTVLIVDDDAKAVEVIASFLPTSAYNIIRAYGGKEAIDMARSVLPDLVLLDLMMPGVDGFQVVDILRQDRTTAAIPIMVITAKEITSEDHVALSGDMNTPIHIVNKSKFNRQGFLDEVRRALLVS